MTGFGVGGLGTRLRDQNLKQSQTLDELQNCNMVNNDADPEVYL